MYISIHKAKAGNRCRHGMTTADGVGASLERPALQRLLHDVEEHRIDCVVVVRSRNSNPFETTRFGSSITAGLRPDVKD